MTQSLSSDLVIGVAGGLAASAVVGILSVYWRRVILPLLEGMAYRGQNVQGDWDLVNPPLPESLSEVKFESDELLVLRQRATHLSGR